ncbi:MAG: pitrilysin family protein [Chloroherpetonaceae bacterium]|nr:pitrilysin family protein [Chloroherpetonaceae bacterium]
MDHSLTENIEQTTLDNGVRVVSENVPHVHSAAIGIFVGVGSRDEPEPLRGVSHFIEHMLFKGTPRRNARQIADEIESRGGQLNAYTTKEMTCYEARVLSEDVALAMDVLTDMFRNSLFDPEEMEREKRVVLEEIKMYEDTPEELIHDVFEATLFARHPLGRPVIGTEETVAHLQHEDVLHYWRTQYLPGRVVVAAAGNLTHRQLVQLTSDMLGDMPALSGKRDLRRPRPSGRSRQMRRRETEQVHFCMGTSAYSKQDRERYALSILSNVLGGNMSSRLFQEVREKRGLVYNIASYGRTYQDGGFFCVFGGTSLETYDEVLRLIRVEFDKILNEGITNDELVKARTQVRGALVIGLESMASRMHRYGETLLAFGRIIPLAEVLAEYEAVTHERIARVARQVLHDNPMTLTAIGPFPARRRAA